ncbi:histone-lysine N-methyltransferase SETMAR-like [Prorops nasuta]|uniref:histone-lysine N-methyltransferase SETMAR-like n=1 Tax=Prorops nasuta TaxID=863751 RepID=UPI0034CDEABD
MIFTKNEYVDMIFAYGEAKQSARRAVQIYKERFPTRRHPDHKVILRVVTNFKATGKVHEFSRNRSCADPELALRVLEYVEENPRSSVRQISRIFNTPISTAWRILRKNALHPFHMQRVHQLLPRDWQPRVNFCMGFLAQCRRDSGFPDQILWTDESTFTPNGVFNSKNYVFWAKENPHATRVGAFQYKWKINVWAGLIGDRVIGPVFFPPKLDGEKYVEFLQEQLPLLLEDVPLLVRENMIFQHDGAPAHFHRNTRTTLDAQFPDRWMGRGGPITWPARSPDLTPLDFFLWGHIKNLVENERGGREEEVRAAIIAAFQTLTSDMVHRATRDIVRRAELCVQQRGRQFEHL